ncbi:hypothetical protein J4463_01800 [Candidatus Pacearchaeota archaeon]|nr:hypothetical protein [Candidatus Pacearchaeota archaeon]
MKNEYDEENFKKFRYSVLAGIIGGCIVAISISIKTTTGTWYSEVFWTIITFAILYVLSMWWCKIWMFRKRNK